MSERLSRVERHRQRYQQRKKPDPQLGFGQKGREQHEFHLSSETLSRTEQEKKNVKTKASSKLYTLTNDRRSAHASELDILWRQLDPGESGESGEAPALLVEELPSRRELFPSQRVKLTRYFFNTLLYIFIAVLILLLWWGFSDSPWGTQQDKEQEANKPVEQYNTR